MGGVTRVKICGITNVEDARLAVELGAWAIGLIFADSPRQVDVTDAEQIGRELSRQVEVVGVFVNTPLEQVAELADVARLTMIQLHGDEGPAYAREVARRTGLRVIKAIQARDPAAVRRLSSFRTDFHLLDAYAPDKRGGTGKTFQWDYVRHHTRHVPLILSGGLTPDNVAEGIEATHPHAVDSASGTEASPGKKDPAKVQALFRAVAEVDAKHAPPVPVPEPEPELEPEPVAEPAAPTEAA
jgi:phosphoribosylanthranilate isomerase